MRCPYCNSELKETTYREFETLSEHVTNPNRESFPLRKTFECVGKCEFSQDGFWDEWGAYYCMWSKGFSTELYHKHEELKKKCVNGFTSAIDSWQRQADIEIYKDDENFKLAKIFGWTIKAKYLYEANEHGDILSRKLKLEFIRPDGTYYISGIKMLVFVIGRHMKSRKYFHDTDYRNDFEYPKYEYRQKDWWRWVAPFILRIIDRAGYLKVSQ